MLRVALPQPGSWLDIYAPHPRLPTWTLQPNIRRLVDTGETRWVIRTDGEGHRVPDPPPPAHPERPVVLFLGDSFIFGHGVDYRASLAALLMARPALRGYRAVNAGVPGYGPIQYRWVLEDLLARGLRPALIILGTYTTNDFLDCIRPTNKPVRNGILGDPGGLKSFLKRHLHLYRMAARAYHAAAGGQGVELAHHAVIFRRQAWSGEPLARARRIYAKEMQRIATLARRRGVPVMAVIFPSLSAVRLAGGASRAEVAAQVQGGEPSMDFAEPERQAEDALAAAGIATVSLTRALSREPLQRVFFRFDTHLTPLGNRVAASVVGPRMDALARGVAAGRGAAPQSSANSVR